MLVSRPILLSAYHSEKDTSQASLALHVSGAGRSERRLRRRMCWAVTVQSKLPSSRSTFTLTDPSPGSPCRSSPTFADKKLPSPHTRSSASTCMLSTLLLPASVSCSPPPLMRSPAALILVPAGLQLSTLRRATARNGRRSWSSSTLTRRSRVATVPSQEENRTSFLGRREREETFMGKKEFDQFTGQILEMGRYSVIRDRASF